MSQDSSRSRLSPWVLLFAIGLCAILWGRATPPAGANVTSTDATTASFDTGGNGTTLTIGAQDDDGNLAVEVTEIDPSSEVTLSAVVCAPLGCPSGSLAIDDSTKTITLQTGAFDPDSDHDALTMTFALNATCTADDTMKVTAKQGDGSGDVDTTIFVQCDSPEPNILIINDAPNAPEAAEFEFSLTSSAAADCETGSFVMVDGQESDFFCEADGTEYTVTATGLPEGWDVTGISCDRENVPSGDVVASVANQRVRIRLNDDDDRVTCTFTSELVATATPALTATPTQTRTPAPTSTPSLPATVDLAATATTIPCNGTSTVTALVRDLAGQRVADGTIVSFVASSGGGLSAGTITTHDGLASVTFNGSSVSASATITAQAAGASKTLQIQVACNGAPPSPPLPAAPVAGAAGPAVITPPRTGDAGLVHGETAWKMYAGLVLICVSTFGGIVTARCTGRIHG